MWPFNKKKEVETTKDARANYDFNDDDRQHAVLMRNMNREMRRMEMEMRRLEMKRQLEEMKEELYGDEEEETDSPEMQLLAPIVAGMLNKSQKPNPQIQSEKISPIQNPANSEGKAHFSDEEIEQIYQAADKRYTSMAKGMPDSLVATFIKQKVPNIDDDSLQRAIKRVKL